MANETKIYFKSPFSGSVISNSVPNSDLSYWKSQGWTLAPQGNTPTPQNQATPPAQAPNTTTSPAPTVQNTQPTTEAPKPVLNPQQSIKLTGPQFDATREAFGVNQSNFNQYFERRGKDIYLRPGFTPAEPGRSEPFVAETPEEFPSELTGSLAMGNITSIDDILNRIESEQFDVSELPGNETLIRRVSETGDQLIANQNFVNAAFKAFHGRDATQTELDRFTGKSVAEVKRKVLGGSPTFADLVDNKDVDVEKVIGQKPADNSVADIPTARNVNPLVDADAAVQAVIDMITQAEQRSADLTEATSDTLERLSERPERRLELEREREVPEKMEKIAEIDAKINLRVAEYNRLKEKISGEAIPMGIIRGQQAQVQRMAAADISVLGAERAMVQGQLDAAQDYIDRALELEFSALEADLAQQKFLLERNDEFLNRAEKKLQTALQIALAEEARVAADMRANKEANYNLMMKIAESGGSLNNFNVNADVSDNIINNAQVLRAQADNLSLVDIIKLSATAANPNQALQFLLDVTGLATPTSERTGLPDIGSSIGSGTITGYGSQFWEHGLDFVLDGGKGAPVELPFNFQIDEIKTEDESDGFGNQVRVTNLDTGEQIWFSHLDNVSIGPGTYLANTMIGTQGNTGNVYSTNGGDGTHLDITMPKPGGGYYRPEEVAIRLGMSRQTGGIGEAFFGPQSDLNSEQVKTINTLTQRINSDPVYKDALEVRAGMLSVIDGLAQGNGFGDVAAINGFQRMVDPGATVREGDVALLQTAAGFLDQIDPKFISGRIKAGDKLPEPVRERMRTLAIQLYERRAQNYNLSSGKRFSGLAQAAGVPFEYVGEEIPEDVSVLFGGSIPGAGGGVDLSDLDFSF